jgi:hypothetical protein
MYAIMRAELTPHPAYSLRNIAMLLLLLLLST